MPFDFLSHPTPVAVVTLHFEILNLLLQSSLPLPVVVAVVLIATLPTTCFAVVVPSLDAWAEQLFHEPTIGFALGPVVVPSLHSWAQP
jgi:hypothetical protein